jgi:hypothetical protein
MTAPFGQRSEARLALHRQQTAWNGTRTLPDAAGVLAVMVLRGE